VASAECPRPVKIGDGKFARNFFPIGDVVAYINGRAGKPPPELSEADRVRLIPAREFRHLLGDVSEMFLWRLLNKNRATPDGAPQPRPRGRSAAVKAVAL
jgi:hypothetical protein